MFTEFSWVGAGITAGITATLALQWWLRRIPAAVAPDPGASEPSPVGTDEFLDARLPKPVILALIATTAILAMLRQDYALLLSDSLLLAALSGIAWWDWQHLTIDIRLVALTALLQLGWAILLVPTSAVELLLGGVFGAGGLYWLGMLYAAVRGLAHHSPHCSPVRTPHWRVCAVLHPPTAAANPDSVCPVPLSGWSRHRPAPASLFVQVTVAGFPAHILKFTTLPPFSPCGSDSLAKTPCTSCLEKKLSVLSVTKGSRSTGLSHPF